MATTTTTTTTAVFFLVSAAGAFACREHDLVGGEFRCTGVRFDAPGPFDDTLPYWAGFFTREEAAALAPDAELVPVPLRMQKEDVYSTISDLSKDLNGFRHRLDVDAYTLEELTEIRDSYSAALAREREEEERQREEERKAQEERQREREAFDSGFNALGGAFPC